MLLIAKFLTFFYEEVKLVIKTFYLMNYNAIFGKLNSQQDFNKKMHNYIHKLRKENPLN